ncbi:MYB DNA-binding domain-containing protein [Purpureocillium lavendulum]|uniref:MYB DNA-binding domain-containing protein n=1 Tax=Purpureocillium lavendulum TaxID=1247861 RepID=A0AB34FB91_9HYPO|nr:MYB DNA-binding domain-containing protein [Purpureocillium lavendulum]
MEDPPASNLHKHSLEAVQSRLLCQDPWDEVGLADSYCVGWYGVDYAAHPSHTGIISQHPNYCQQPEHQEQPHQQQHFPYSTQQDHQHRQHRGSIHYPGVGAQGPNTAPPGVPSFGQLSNRSVVSLGQKQPEAEVPMMDLSHHIHGHRLSHVHFGMAGPVSTLLYGAVSSATQSPYASYSVPAAKRSRTDEFCLSAAGVPMMVDQSALAGVVAKSSSEACGQSVAAIAKGAAVVNYQEQPQLYPHHRLPELGQSSKSMQTEEIGSVPSIVGQPGMPAPARRHRGPKLKFSAEDDQLLLELKEKKNLTWKQIAGFFPGRSSGTLQVRYCTKLKGKTTRWTEEMDEKLRKALQYYERKKWRMVAHKIGSGFTPAACRERSHQLAAGGKMAETEGQVWQSLSAKAPSLPESWRGRQHTG